MKSYLLVLSVFAVACGTAEKEDTADTTTQPSSEPASAPTSSPTSEPSGEILLYYTSQWAGEWTVADGALTGYETLLSSGGFVETSGTVACDYYWDLSGAAPAEASCEDCVWEFEVSATGNADNSTLNSADCALEDATFTYAYTPEYMVEGQSMGPALLYADAQNEIGAFVWPSNPEAPTDAAFTSEMNWDEAAGTFSYTSGYVDYEYLYQY